MQPFEEFVGQSVWVSYDDSGKVKVMVCILIETSESALVFKTNTNQLIIPINRIYKVKLSRNGGFK